MAEGSDKNDRTEAPTPRRRERAREKGDRPASRDLSTAFAGAAGALWLWQSAGDFADGLRTSLALGLSIAPADITRFRPLEALTSQLLPLGAPLAKLAALVMVAAALGQAAAGGLGFAPGRIAPDIARLDPLAGLQRLLGRHGMIELAKALVKAAMLIGLAAWVLWQSRAALAALSAAPIAAAMAGAAGMALQLVLLLCLGLALIGAVDLPLQIRMWIRRLRMSRQEIRDEFKQQEGAPELKQAMRRLARDSLKRANRAAMAEATVVLVNPTHFAVALRYQPDTDAAPVIVARGRGVVAEAIRSLAAEFGVTTLSYPSVTRALYFTGRVGAPIRTDLYAAVATILAFVLRVGGPLMPQPHAEAPPTARFDTAGRRTSDGD